MPGQQAAENKQKNATVISQKSRPQSANETPAAINHTSIP
jgi:hypothetical protein